jgi:hypothetical protein
LGQLVIGVLPVLAFAPLQAVGLLGVRGHGVRRGCAAPDELSQKRHAKFTSICRDIST